METGASLAVAKEKIRDEIRNKMKLWIKATADNDIDTVLALLSDEVVFLQPGQPIMTKVAFAAASSSASSMRIEGSAEPIDIHVSDSLDMAMVYSKLQIAVFKRSSADTSTPIMKRSGYVLSGWRKENICTCRNTHNKNSDDQGENKTSSSLSTGTSTISTTITPSSVTTSNHNSMCRCDKPVTWVLFRDANMLTLDKSDTASSASAPTPTATQTDSAAAAAVTSPKKRKSEE